MKAYLSIQNHSDKRTREVIEQISPVLTVCGFETVCMRRDIEQWGAVALSPREHMVATFDAIRSCQMLVIDVTEANVGVGIEAGYAYAHSVPVFTIAREGTEISTTLDGLSSGIGFYRDLQDLRSCFTQLGLLMEEAEDKVA